MENTREAVLAACDLLTGMSDGPLAKFFTSPSGLEIVRQRVEAQDEMKLSNLALSLFAMISGCESEWEERELLAPMFHLLRVWKHAFGLAEEKSLVGLEQVESHMKVIPGSLRIEGDCRVAGALIVLGDLEVQGTLGHYGEDWWSGTVVVLGKLTCSRLVAMGPAAVGSMLTVKEGVYSEYYHDCPSTFLAGEVQTPVVAEFGDHAGFYAEKGDDELIKLRLDKDAIPSPLDPYFGISGRTFDLKEAGQGLFAALAEVARRRS